MAAGQPSYWGEHVHPQQFEAPHGDPFFTSSSAGGGEQVPPPVLGPKKGSGSAYSFEGAHGGIVYQGHGGGQYQTAPPVGHHGLSPLDPSLFQTAIPAPPSLTSTSTSSQPEDASHMLIPPSTSSSGGYHQVLSVIQTTLDHATKKIFKLTYRHISQTWDDVSHLTFIFGKLLWPNCKRYCNGSNCI